MSETEAAPRCRHIHVDGEGTWRVTLSDDGLTLWVSASEWPQFGTFPLPRRGWADFKVAVDEILVQATEQARIDNAFDALVDPIDGPNGEA